MDLHQIKQILDLVREHELSEFEIEHDGLRLKIRKDLQPQPVFFDFEFRQLVLAHEVENLLQFVEVH